MAKLLWSRRVISVVGAFVYLFPGRSEAEIRILPTDDPSENACFIQDVNDALAVIKNTDPTLRDVIAWLESSPVRHTIKQTEGIIISHGESDHHTDIEYNPRYKKRFPGDGVCIDPVAGLLHECCTTRSRMTSAYSKQTEKWTVQARTIYL